MSSHVRILGWLFTVICGGALAALLIFGALAAKSPSPPTPYALSYVMPPVLAVSAVILLPGFIGGLALLSRRPWARILIMVPSIFLLPFIPIGTALGIYALWTVLHPEANAAFGVAGRRGLAAYFPISSPAVSLVGFMACIGAVFFFFLKAMFIYHGDPQPDAIASSASTIIAIVALTAGGAVVTIGAIVKRHRHRAYVPELQARLAAGMAAEREVTRREIEAHPEWKGVGQIVEEEDEKAAQRAAAATRLPPGTTEAALQHAEDVMDIATANPICEHLLPIYEAITGRGVKIKIVNRYIALARVRVDYAEFNRSYGRGPVVYRDFIEEPGNTDRATSYIICEEHQGTIHTVHPAESPTDAPWFP